MIGVDYDLFWTLNPKSLTPFVKAFELKQKHSDGENWHLGMYVKLAVASSLSDKVKYPKQPLSGRLDDEIVSGGDEEELRKRKQLDIQNRFMRDIQHINITRRKEKLSDG